MTFAQAPPVRAALSPADQARPAERRDIRTPTTPLPPAADATRPTRASEKYSLMVAKVDRQIDDIGSTPLALALALPGLAAVYPGAQTAATTAPAHPRTDEQTSLFIISAVALHERTNKRWTKVAPESPAQWSANGKYVLDPNGANLAAPTLVGALARAPSRRAARTCASRNSNANRARQTEGSPSSAWSLYPFRRLRPDSRRAECRSQTVAIC